MPSHSLSKFVELSWWSWILIKMISKLFCPSVRIKVFKGTSIIPMHFEPLKPIVYWIISVKSECLVWVFICLFCWPAEPLKSIHIGIRILIVLSHICWPSLSGHKVLFTEIIIRKHTVCFIDLFEFGLITLVDIRVILLCESIVCLFDLCCSCVLVHVQDLKIILWGVIILIWTTKPKANSLSSRSSLFYEFN